MRTLAELFLDEKNVDPKLIKEEIATIIEKAAKPRLFGRELVKIKKVSAPTFTFFRRTTKSFPVHKGKSGANKPAAPDAERVKIDVSVDNYWVDLEWTEDMIDDKQFDLMADDLEIASFSMALQETQDIIDGLIAGAGNTVAADSAGTLGPDDLADAVNRCEVDDYYPTTILMHPDQAYDLKVNTDLVDSSYIGGSEIIREGRLPIIQGLNVMVTRLISSGTALVLDPKWAAYLVMRQDLSMKNIEDPFRDIVGQRLKQRRGFAIRQPDAICTITNC